MRSKQTDWASEPDYRVSVLQFEPRLMDTDANLRALESLLGTLETDLVVLPELCTSGYVFQKADEVAEVTEQIPGGKSFDRFREIAEQRDFSIVYGFAEKTEEGYYNSAALLNPNGTYHVYRKTHLFFREKLFFLPGNTGFKVVQAKGGVKVGMMVCFDWQFPEAARTLSLRGAQIICHPSNLVLPWCQQAMITRSLENRVFSITSNRTGTESNGALSISFTGQSQILNTTGEILTRLNDTESGVRTCVIKPGQALNKQVTMDNDAFADRRPEHYQL